MLRSFRNALVQHTRLQLSLSGLCVAWMPDELSPAHNIVCWGSSVWHRSVEEKLCWYENQPDQSNCQGGLYTMMNRWSDQSNCQGGLHTMLDRSPVRSSRAAISWFGWNTPHNHSPMERSQTHILTRIVSMTMWGLVQISLWGPFWGSGDISAGPNFQAHVQWAV